MKKISQKDLDKLKGKGWELTPDSKKSIQDRDRLAMKSKQVKAITNLSESVDGIKGALQENTGKDYTDFFGKLIESIQRIQLQPAETVKQESGPDGWKFIVNRNSEGMISEIVAKKI